MKEVKYRVELKDIVLHKTVIKVLAAKSAEDAVAKAKNGHNGYTVVEVKPALKYDRETQ
jgi:hypothetical protein